MLLSRAFACIYPIAMSEPVQYIPDVPLPLQPVAEEPEMEPGMMIGLGLALIIVVGLLLALIVVLAQDPQAAHHIQRCY